MFSLLDAFRRLVLLVPLTVPLSYLFSALNVLNALRTMGLNNFRHQEQVDAARNGEYLTSSQYQQLSQQESNLQNQVNMGHN
ncbi:MAG TPA: hypothetical protein V6C97_19480 [Oculatellaceae cyanobacterium]